jgi:hypothetical protein
MLAGIRSAVWSVVVHFLLGEGGGNHKPWVTLSYLYVLYLSCSKLVSCLFFPSHPSLHIESMFSSVSIQLLYFRYFIPVVLKLFQATTPLVL